MKHFLTLHFFIFLAFCADISVRELGLLRILESFRKNEKDVVSEPVLKILAKQVMYVMPAIVTINA